MTAKEFVIKWLDAHRSYNEAYEVTAEEQAHFVQIITDIIEAREKDITIDVIKKVLDAENNAEPELRALINDQVILSTEEYCKIIQKYI